MPDAKRERPHPSESRPIEQQATSGDTRLEDRPQSELFELARHLDIPGHTEMSKTELVEAIRRR